MSWDERALAAVLARAGATLAEAGGRFPLYADPGDGRWTTTRRGSWTGGFWAGLLWLRARHSGVAADRAAAQEASDRLARWLGADTATRGLIFWYGTSGAAARGLRDRAARDVLAAFDPALGLVPWGAALGGPRLLARVDGVPGLVPLLAGAGPDGAAAAASHLRRHLRLCLSPDGRVRPAWHLRPGAEPRPADEPPPGWSRGPAWLLLAVADALHTLVDTDGLPAAADRLARTVRSGPPVPSADAARPAGPPDTSAAAITAVALLKLSAVTGEPSLRARAVTVLRTLVTDHLTDSTAPGPRPPGMLVDGCYDEARGTAMAHELIWGDYFLALGLAQATGLVGEWEV